MVEDALQGRGIGSVLIEFLAAAARKTGIERFVAEVLPTNATMLRVFADAGYQVDRKYADGVVHLSFPIAPTERVARGAVEPRGARGVPLDRPPPRAPRRRGLRRQLHRPRHRRGRARPPARRRLHRRDRARAPERHPGRRHAGRRPRGRREDRDRPRRRRRPARRRSPGSSPTRPPPACTASSWSPPASREAGPAGAAAELELIRAAHAAGMRVVGPNCLGIANTDPAVRLNATLAPRLPAPGPRRLLQPVRRPRRGPAGRGGPARAGPLVVRLGRQPRRRVRQRPAPVLARRPRHRRDPALPGDVR